MKKTLTLLTAIALFTACGNSDNQQADDTTAANNVPSTEDYDPNRGLGPHDAYVYAETPDATLVAEGEKIAGSKCKSCHKMTDERLVGPGWKGVTERRTGAWLMNFITNPDPMIDKDPELQAQLEICLVRMPNQNVAEAEAKAIVEFMRQNDLTN
jgi:mono/diheme cytochrome c family protein